MSASSDLIADGSAIFSKIQPYLGNIHELLPMPLAGTLLVLVAMLCGIIVGFERESRHKPAGLRTVTLICVGSTIYTLASLLIAGLDADADRGRIAAQIVTGIGFLGAGAIIRDHGTVKGMTTGATIWVIAAIGLLVGIGYAVGGIALSVIVVILLRGIRRWEADPSQNASATRLRVSYVCGDPVLHARVLDLLASHPFTRHGGRFLRHGSTETLDVQAVWTEAELRVLLAALNHLHGVCEVQIGGVAADLQGFSQDQHMQESIMS